MRIPGEELRQHIYEHRKVYIVLLALSFILIFAFGYVYGCVSNDKILTTKEFTAEFPVFLIVCSVLPTIVFGVLSFFMFSTISEEQMRLRNLQKERLSILPRFSPGRYEMLYGRQSIYHAIMGSIERAYQSVANDKMGDEEHSMIARLLLCSPALDYPERVEKKEGKYQHWGDKFSEKLLRLAINQKTHTDITFLSDSAGAGFHPLDDFIQVLSSYCESRSVLPFESIYKGISKSTSRIIQHLKTEAETAHRHVTIRQHVQNIPFQIILFSSRSCHEVVVSFAGHEILEDAQSKEPIGFFSSDRYVVEQFEKVYNEYVAERRRRPFTPLHTKKVIKRHGQEKTEYRLNDYLGYKCNVWIYPNVFSPLYGNSTKFTSWVITKILEGERKVLDIGTGTGALALLAEQVLKQKAGENQIRVVAIECAGHVYENLRKNIEENRSAVVPVLGVVAAKTSARLVEAWKLITKDEIKDEKGRVRTNLCDAELHVLEDGEEIEDGVICGLDANGKMTRSDVDDEKFDIVIADIPFVDALPSAKEERAFLDMGHRLHKTLFLGITKHNKWLEEKGMLITSLSSLGGWNDGIGFERLVDKCELRVMQKHCFYESEYMWIVYVLMRKADMSNVDAEAYWRSRLHLVKGDGKQGVRVSG